MTSINPITFFGGTIGLWKVVQMHTIVGDPLATVSYVDAHTTHHPALPSTTVMWTLKGTNTHPRYAERTEVNALQAVQAPLQRPEATMACLIPIRKSAAWWALAQDERRKIFEEESQHIALSMAYLPAIARRLYHGRELGEPFDFLTWFEFAPEHESVFNALLVKLRNTREWTFVDREIDIRLQIT